MHILFNEFFTLLCIMQVIPCVILSIFIHPYVHYFPILAIPFAFCVYLEALSVLPQLHLMQNVKVNPSILLICCFLIFLCHINHITRFVLQMIEPFAAHYVFALGLSRFFAWAHWILQVGLVLVFVKG